MKLSENMTVNSMEDDTKPRKDKNCIHCARLFSCTGKPPGVNLCINFIERTDNNGRSENVHEKDN